MVQRTVLKLNIPCPKCQRQVLKAVAELEGVDAIAVDAAKGTLTVTGNADPYDIIKRIRKTGKHVEVVSIGPPPKKEGEKSDGQKTGDKEPKEKNVRDPYTCPQCQRFVVIRADWDYQPILPCSIL